MASEQPGPDPRPAAAPGPDPAGGENPMLVLVSGILLLGGIALFIGWGLGNAYPAG